VDETNPKRAALAKVDFTGTRLLPIIDYREGIWASNAQSRAAFRFSMHCWMTASNW